MAQKDFSPAERQNIVKYLKIGSTNSNKVVEQD
jgi:hypothetical protein